MRQVVSFGSPLTRTRWASVALDVATVASLGVARSGETFNLVSFGLIPSHFLIVCAGRWRRGCEVPAFAGTTAWIR